MPRIPYRFPEPGEDPIADRVRQRRGARGLTPLDGILLNAPNIADGWNMLIGTLRTNNSLPGDIRELLILRIAALNKAAFEWIHHEHVGRAAGLTTAQLAVIGDTSLDHVSPSTSFSELFNPLQLAALAFVDASTKSVRVPDEVFASFKYELGRALEVHNPSNVTVERQLVEATTTVGAYNLVSRFLVALDVDDRADQPVPAPKRSEEPGSGQTFMDYPVYIEPEMTLHTRVHFHPTDPKEPALIFINSLLTNTSMWNPVLPSLAKSYTLITFDQRGHGSSSVPSSNNSIKQLANDVSRVLDYLNIKKVHGVIGVSQGGATALSFALQYPSRLNRLVVCDTQASSPPANKAAWDERIALARKEGMGKLAEATAGRWFPAPGSPFAPGGEEFETLKEMIVGTPIDGFARSAAALQSYDLRAEGLIETLRKEGQNGLRLLLLAGELDGKLPQGLKDLKEEIGGEYVEFASIEGSGHLPMLDHPDRFVAVVEPFLKS